MNYNYLKYFKVLAETEHYTQAAEILNISQPSLSHAIDEIEKELNIQLFEKHGRNIKLTKYGTLFYNYINDGLKSISDGIQRLKSMSRIDSGTIDLGFIYTLGSYYIPNVIKSFLKENPNITFNLHQGTSNTIIDQLEREELDIGLCSHIESSDKINFIPIIREEVVLIVSNNHPLAAYDTIDLTTINKNEPWILYSKTSGLRSYLDSVFETLNMKPNIRCEIEEDNAAIGLVDINYGIALVPDLSFTSLHNIKKIRIQNKLPERTIYLATLKSRYMTPSTTLLINYLVYNTFDIETIQK